MRRDSLPVLYAKGLGHAFTTWKALLFLLAINALLALAVARPVTKALAETLDRNPYAEKLEKGADLTFFTHFERSRPDVLGGLSAFDDAFSGGAVKTSALKGPAGTLVFLGLLNSFLAALAAGGFAGRFGASRDRASLSAFGSDCGRFAFSSVVLWAISMAALFGVYRGFTALGSLYETSELRYEWLASGLLWLRLGLALFLAGVIRSVIVFARAFMGATRNGSPFLALASGAGFVLGRLPKVLTLEVLFGATALLPLALWGLYGTTWDGRDPARLALFVALQQLVVLLRIAARVGHLGAASSWLKRAAEAARPAPEKIEVEPGSRLAQAEA